MGRREPYALEYPVLGAVSVRWIVDAGAGGYHAHDYKLLRCSADGGQRRGLVIEVTDGSTYRYRGNLYYSLAKFRRSTWLRHGGRARPYQVTALSVTPGFLRSEQMLDHFGVTEDNWQDAAAQEPHFIESETPISLRRAFFALAPIQM